MEQKTKGQLLLEKVQKQKQQKQTPSNKIIGKKKNKDAFRRVNFNG